MIKCNIEAKREVMEVYAEGRVSEVLADITALTTMIISELGSKRDKLAALKMLAVAFSDEDSPVYEEVFRKEGVS